MGAMQERKSKRLALSKKYYLNGKEKKLFQLDHSEEKVDPTFRDDEELKSSHLKTLSSMKIMKRS